MLVGENIKVKFQHDTTNNHLKGLLRKGEISKLKFKHSTPCSTTVQIYKGDELVSTATVKCSLYDNFSRAFGRARALSKAILNYNISDEEGQNILGALSNLPSHKRSGL